MTSRRTRQATEMLFSGCTVKVNSGFRHGLTETTGSCPRITKLYFSPLPTEIHLVLRSIAPVIAAGGWRVRRFHTYRTLLFAVCCIFNTDFHRDSWHPANTAHHQMFLYQVNHVCLTNDTWCLTDIQKAFSSDFQPTIIISVHRNKTSPHQHKAMQPREGKPTMGRPANDLGCGLRLKYSYTSDTGWCFLLNADLDCRRNKNIWVSGRFFYSPCETSWTHPAAFFITAASK